MVEFIKYINLKTHLSGRIIILSAISLMLIVTTISNSNAVTKQVVTKSKVIKKGAVNSNKKITRTSTKRVTNKNSYTPLQTSLVVDAKTGKILHSRNARKAIYPASLTKVMTLYIVFEQLRCGKLRLNQEVVVSKKATAAVPMKLYLKKGQKVKIKDLILALIVKSANDAAIVLAEAVAGSEYKFARLMTIRARQLGMKNTTFTNASGLYDRRQKSTAIDLAKMAIAVKRDFPQYKHLFAKTSFKFNRKLIKGHNQVTLDYPGADGMKTGYLNKSGCNIITTAQRGNKSLVAVVTGAKNAAARNIKTMNLLDQHFKSKNKPQLAKASKKTPNTKTKKIAAIVK